MHPDSTPTDEEQREFSIRALKGADMGLNKDDPGQKLAADLADKHPDHLILVQAGKFLHAYDKSAHILATLKGYTIQLAGTAKDHIRVGFPVSNFKRRLWPIVAEFGTPYVVAIGSKAMGYTLYISDEHAGEETLMAAVPDDIVAQIIKDLRKYGETSNAEARELLTKPDSVGFKLKSKAQELDSLVLNDIIKMPRDLRATYGENLRSSMARLVHQVHAYGTSTCKRAILHSISSEIDTLKHYITQAQGISRLKFSIVHRASLIVELGKLTGGLIRSLKEEPCATKG